MKKVISLLLFYLVLCPNAVFASEICFLNGTTGSAIISDFKKCPDKQTGSRLMVRVEPTVNPAYAALLVCDFSKEILIIENPSGDSSVACIGLPSGGGE